ncbi:MAG: hypothetical protein KGL39_09325 [Patescibacteria group bacterium]|nr:hypothetical protein [Patescibacteria group bacterium]
MSLDSLLTAYDAGFVTFSDQKTPFEIVGGDDSDAYFSTFSDALSALKTAGVKPSPTANGVTGGAKNSGLWAVLNFDDSFADDSDEFDGPSDAVDGGATPQGLGAMDESELEGTDAILAGAEDETWDWVPKDLELTEKGRRYLALVREDAFPNEPADVPADARELWVDMENAGFVSKVRNKHTRRNVFALDQQGADMENYLLVASGAQPATLRPTPLSSEEREHIKSAALELSFVRASERKSLDVLANDLAAAIVDMDTFPDENAYTEGGSSRRTTKVASGETWAWVAKDLELTGKGRRFLALVAILGGLRPPASLVKEDAFPSEDADVPPDARDLWAELERAGFITKVMNKHTRRDVFALDQRGADMENYLLAVSGAQPATLRATELSPSEREHLVRAALELAFVKGVERKDEVKKPSLDALQNDAAKRSEARIVAHDLAAAIDDMDAFPDVDTVTLEVVNEPE